MVNGNGKQLRRLLKELPVLAKDLVVFLLIFGLILLPVPMTASAAPMKKWAPHVDITGKLGNERSLGDADLFIPVLQGPDSLFFLDLRFQRDDNDVKEGNYGLGFRKMLDEWIVGGYGFYDVRDTQYDNTFQQWTLGVEALSENYDARLNIYIADEDEEEIGGLVGVDRFIYSGNYLLYGGSYEKSMSGVDFEIGGKLPGMAYPEVRGYVGGYYFDADHTDEVTGPRGRLEVRFPDMFGWDGSLFEVGGEVRHDSERDTDYFFTARVRIPFGSGTISQPTSSLTPLEKRMTERIQRDPDIVTTRVGATGTQPLTLGGEAIDITHVNDDGAGGSGTVEDPFGTLTNAAGSTTDIVLLHADSEFDGEGYVMADDQRLLGESADFDHPLDTDQFGLITLPKVTDGVAKPVISNGSINAGNNSEISNLVMQDVPVEGIFVGSNVTDTANINNVDFISGATPIHVYNSSGNIMIDTVTITDPESTGFKISGGTANVAILNSSVTQTADDGRLLLVTGVDSDPAAPHTGALVVDGTTTLTAYNGAGLMFDGADGTYDFYGPVVLDGSGTGGDTGIDVVDDSDGQIVFYNSVAINNPVGDAVVMTDSPGVLAFTGDAPLTIVTGDGDGIYAANSGALVVQGSGNSVDATGGAALYVMDTATDLEFATLTSTESPSVGVGLYNVAGIGTAGNALIVTGDTTVTGAGGDGIDIIELAGGSTVTFNSVTVGDSGTNGIALIANAGTITVDGPATIYNSGSGTGLDIEVNTAAITFNDTLDIADSGEYGMLVAANTGAVTVEGATTVDNSGPVGVYVVANENNVVFNSTLDISNSVGDGMYITGNSAPVTVEGATTIYNSVHGSGLFVAGNQDAISFNNTLDIDDSGMNGVVVTGNSGAFTVEGATTVDNSGLTGVYITGNGYNAITFNDTLDVADSGSDGVLIAGNTGTVTVAGATTIYNSALGSGLYVAGNQDAVSFNDILDVDDSGLFGVYVAGNTGAFTVDGATTVDDSGLTGVYITGNGYNAVTFNDTLDVTNSNGGDGVAILGNTGTVTVAGATTIYNSALGSGLYVAGNQDAVAFNDILDVDDSAMSGVWVAGNTGAFTVEGATTVDNSGLYGVYVAGNGYNAVTFNDTLDVTDSGSEGVFIAGNTGSVTVAGATTIYNSGFSGLYVASNQGAVSFNDTLEIDDSGMGGAFIGANQAPVTVAGATTITNSALFGLGIDSNLDSVSFDSSIDIRHSGEEGMYVVGNTGEVSVDGAVTIDDSGFDGLYVGSNTNSVTLASTLDVTNSLYNGVVIVGNSGDVTIYNTVTIDNSGSDGFISALNTGDVSLYNALNVTNSGDHGILLAMNDGEFAAGDTTVTTTGGAGIRVDTNYNSATFGDIFVEDTGNQGIYISDTTGDFTAPTTTVYNSAAGFAAVEVGETQAAIDFGIVDIMTDETESTGLLTYNMATLNIDGGTIVATDATAISMYNTTIAPGSVELSFVSSNSADNEGIYMERVDGGPVTIDQAVITGAGTEGIAIYNSSSAIEITDIDVTTTGGHGILLAGNSGTFNAATVDVTDTGGNGIYVLANEAAVAMDNVTVSDTTYNGVVLEGNLAGGTFTALDVDITDTDAAGMLIDGNGGVVDITDLEISETGNQGLFVIDTTADVTVGNALVYNSAAGYAAVEIGETAANITFDNLDIHTDAAEATGFMTYNTASVGVAAGTIAVADATAIDMYNTTVLGGGVNFASVSSNGANEEGVVLENVDGGAVIIDSVTVTNSGAAGVEILDTASNVEMTTVSVTTTGGHGILLENNTGNYNATTINVTDTTLAGMVIDTNQGLVEVDNLTITETDNQGLFVTETTGNVTIGSATVYNSAAGYAAVEIGETNADVTFGTVDISTVASEATGFMTYNTASVGIGAGTIAVADATAIDMYNTTVLGSGINLSSVSSNSADFEGIYMERVDGGPVTIDQAVITGAGTEGIAIYNSSSAIEITDIDVTTTGGHGILLAGNSGTFNAATVDVTDTGGNGIYVLANEAAVAMDNVTVSDTDAAGMLIDSNGGVVAITDLEISETGNQGLFIIDTTADVTLGTTTVYNSAENYAAVEIGETQAAIDLGVVDISTIASEATGLMTYNMATLNIEDGTIVANDATAIDMYNTTIFPGSVTLSSVTSNSADGEGIFMFDVDGGSVTIDQATITNAGSHGIAIYNSASAIEITDVDVTNTGGHGLFLWNNTGAYNSTTIDVVDAGMNGIMVYNTAGGVDLGIVTVENVTGGAGVAIFENDGTVTAGTTTVTGTVADGVIVGSNHAAVSFTGDLSVTDAGIDGVEISDNDAPVSVAGTTTIYNSGVYGLYVGGNAEAVTFNDDVTVTESGSHGVVIGANNTVDVLGAVSVYNAGGMGVVIDDQNNDVTFAATNVYNSTSIGVLALDSLGPINLGVVNIETDEIGAAGLVVDNVDSLEISDGNITSTNALALAMQDTGIATGGVTLYNVTSLNNTVPTAAGIYLNNVTGGDVSITGTATVYNSAGAGIEVINSESNVFIGAVDIDRTLEEGILIEESSGDFTVDTTTWVTRTGDSGVVVYNSTGTVDLGENLVINDTGNHGIALYNSAAFALTGGTIDNTTNTGVYAVDTSLALDGTEIGVGGTIGAAGVAVSTTDADDISVALDNLTLSNIGTTGILIDGSAGSGTLYVTSFDSNTVTDAGWKGVEVDTATFDADPSTMLVDSVTGGTTMIGDSADTTQINLAGMVLYNVAGSIGFDELSIYNDGGTGLYIRDAGGKTGDFAFSTADGEVVTTNGTALDIDPVALDMTLSNVSSSDAGGAGIILDTVSGTVDIGTVSVTNSGGAGVSISNSTADVTIGTLGIDITGAEGVLLENNDGSFAVSGDTTIDNTTGAGLAVYNSASTDTVSFAGNVTVRDSSAEGIALVDNAGNFEILGTTTVDNAGAASVAIYNTVGNEYTGDVDLGLVNITDRQATGLYIFGTNAAINVNDISIDGNNPTAGISIEDTGASGSVTISSASVSNSGAEGIALYDNEGDVSILGGTISAASGTAFLVDGGSSTVVYNGSIVNNSVGYSVEIANVTGGSVNLDGDIIDTGQGIYIHDNSGGDINFTGTTLSLTPVVPTTTPLNIVDNAGSVITFDNDTFTLVSSIATALNATGGGTLNILGPDNEIIAQTGQAVNISDMEVDITLNTIFSTSSLGGAGVSIYNTLAGSSFVALGDGSVPSTILSPMGDGIVIEESEGTFVFNDMTVTSPMYNGVVLTNNDADITFNDLTVTGSVTSAVGVAATNSSVTLNSATLSNTVTSGVDVLVNDGSTYNVAVLDSTISSGVSGVSVAVYNSGVLNSSVDLLIQGNDFTVLGTDIVLGGNGDINLGAEQATLDFFGLTPEPYSSSLLDFGNVLATENPGLSSVLLNVGPSLYLYNAASLGF